MKVTLRKAHALQHEILRVIQTRKPQLTVDMDESVIEVRGELARLQSKRERDFLDCVKLSETLTDIRKQVARVNHAAGITDLLCELAHWNRLIELASGTEIGSAVEPGEIDRVEFQLINARKRESVYGRHSVFVMLSSRSDLDKQINQYRRRVANINDQLLEANVANHIELTEEQVVLLRAAGVID